MRQIQVVVFAPGQKAEVRTVSSEYDPIRKIIDGPIQMVGLAPLQAQPRKKARWSVLLCHEEAKLIGLPHCRDVFISTTQGHHVHGTFIICATGPNGDWWGLTDDEANQLVAVDNLATAAVAPWMIR